MYMIRPKNPFYPYFFFFKKSHSLSTEKDFPHKNYGTILNWYYKTEVRLSLMDYWFSPFANLMGHCLHYVVGLGWVCGMYPRGPTYGLWGYGIASEPFPSGSGFGVGGLVGERVQMERFPFDFVIVIIMLVHFPTVQ